MHRVRKSSKILLRIPLSRNYFATPLRLGTPSGHKPVKYFSHEISGAGQKVVELCKLSRIRDAKKEFDSDPDPAGAAALIDVYGRKGRLDDAFRIYHKMEASKSLGRSPLIFCALLNACRINKQFRRSLPLFEEITRHGLPITRYCFGLLCQAAAATGDGVTATKLVDYVREEDEVKMKKELPPSVNDNRTRAALNELDYAQLMQAFAKSSLLGKALELLEMMERNGATPNTHALSSLLTLCANTGDLEQGRLIHRKYIRNSLTIHLGNALINMYGKCGDIVAAREAFDQMREDDRDAISYTALLNAYLGVGDGSGSLRVFDVMQRAGVPPDVVAYSSALMACASASDLSRGKQIHAQMKETLGAKQVEESDVVNTALITMYSGCQSMPEARKIFEERTKRSKNVEAWNAMATGYLKAGEPHEALKLYEQVMEMKLAPTVSTFLVALGACTRIPDVHYGERVRKQLETLNERWDKTEQMMLSNALISLYAKCGDLVKARTVFDHQVQTGGRHSIVTWTAMLDAYGEHGVGKEALLLFQEMRTRGLSPNEVTYISVLNACSHAGLVTEGRRTFEEMVSEGIKPSVRHYNCMVDLLGRAGKLDEAEKVIASMPVPPNIVTWTSLLAACGFHGDVERGRRAADNALALAPTHAPTYVLLSNLLANAKLWDEKEKVRQLMKDRGVKKIPGRTWATTQTSTQVHSFMAHDTSHPYYPQIMAKLQELRVRMKEAGFVHSTEVVMHDALSEEEKEDHLCGHSEKLALAFLLITTPPGTPIFLYKNLRMCHDCHAATKMISRVECRTVTMRDASRFHEFKDGKCSCDDYY